MEMYYNGFLLSNLINVTNVKRPPIGERIINSISIPSRNGEVFQNSTFGTKTITVDFYMKYGYLPDASDESSEYQKVVTSLAYYLASNTEPAPLIFSDQPNLYYEAIVESFDLERLLRLGQGTITFRCLSPYLYSTNKYQNTGKGSIVISNDATASCYPIFETTLTKDTKYLLYVGKNGAIQVGNSSDSTADSSGEGEEKPTNYIIHSDNCTSSARWYAGSSSLLWANRVVDTSVSLVSTGKGLHLNKATSGEEGSGKYHGAWYMTDLDDQAMYWQAKLYFKFKSQPSYASDGDSPAQQGMIEMYLFDTNNVPLVNFSMRDFYATSEFNQPFLFNGHAGQMWKDAEIVNASTGKITDNFKSLSEVPKNATILSKSQFTVYRAEVKWNGTPIYKEQNENGAYYYKTGTGTKFIIASNSSTWCRVYLDSTKTTTGFILMKHINKVADHTEYLVTYQTANTSTGKWDDFVGCVVLERRPHSSGKGSCYNMYLYKKKGNDSWNGDIELKKTETFYDPTDTTFSTGGKLAKVGIFLSGYQDAQPPQGMVFDDLVVQRLVSSKEIEEEETETGTSMIPVGYIGVAGDVIKVDCGEQMVYNNNEPIMEFVDVGSDFFSIDAFSSSEIRIISDDTNAETVVTYQKRYL